MGSSGTSLFVSTTDFGPGRAQRLSPRPEGIPPVDGQPRSGASEAYPIPRDRISPAPARRSSAQWEALRSRDAAHMIALT